MGAITRAFANNITTGGKFQAGQLSGNLPALDGSNLTGISAGGGMRTLLNTYVAAGVSTDLEMDFPVNGGGVVDRTDVEILVIVSGSNFDALVHLGDVVDLPGDHDFEQVVGDLLKSLPTWHRRIQNTKGACLNRCRIA